MESEAIPPAPTPAALIQIIRHVHDAGLLPTPEERVLLREALDALVSERREEIIDGADPESSIIAPMLE